MTRITPELLLRAYVMGVFPMAQTREATEIHWVDPRRRGVFDLDHFHISRSLAKTIRQGRFGITIDTAFADVVQGCADRPETWINDEIFALYADLHAMGSAHSLEVWEGDALVGGVYGVSLGAAFFGESMFSRRTDASKVALAWLIHRLRAGGFTLFDTQFLTPHLASLGAVEITRAAYQKRLITALAQTASFSPEDYSPASSSVAASAVPSSPGTSQRKTQTS